MNTYKGILVLDRIKKRNDDYIEYCFSSEENLYHLPLKLYDSNGNGYTIDTYYQTKENDKHLYFIEFTEDILLQNTNKFKLFVPIEEWKTEIPNYKIEKIVYEEKCYDMHELLDEKSLDDSLVYSKELSVFLSGRAIIKECAKSITKIKEYQLQKSLIQSYFNGILACISSKYSYEMLMCENSHKFVITFINGEELELNTIGIGNNNTTNITIDFIQSILN